MRAELLSIGTELLLGEIVDTNSAYLARRLAGLGIDLLYCSTVGDNLDRATAAIRRALERSDLLVTTGGLGPTEDDLTREAISLAIGEEPRVDPSLEAGLRDWFDGRALTMPDRNRKQAWLVPSARALANPLGTAPGWNVEKEGRRIVAMPGVPREMTRMWELEVEPTLFAGAVLRSRTLKLLGIGEGSVEETLAELVRSTSPTVATYAKSDGVHVRMADKGADVSEVDARLARMEGVIRERLGRWIWGADEDTLGGVVGALLARRGWRLATAEALSAGEIARTLSGAGIGVRYAGGLVLPGRGADELRAAIAPLAAEVTLVVPHDEEETTIAGRSPERSEEQTVRFRSIEDGRRRSAFAAFDLLRRLLL